MFALLVQVHVARGAMLSGPSCVDGQFVPSDNFVGNNDNANKLKAKGPAHCTRSHAVATTTH